MKQILLILDIKSQFSQNNSNPWFYLVTSENATLYN